MLLAARHAYWKWEQVPADLEGVWEAARRLIPEWPGFKRLYLADADRQAAETAEARADKFWEELRQVADDVELLETETGTKYKWVSICKGNRNHRGGSFGRGRTGSHFNSTVPRLLLRVTELDGQRIPRPDRISRFGGVRRCPRWTWGSEPILNQMVVRTIHSRSSVAA